MDKTVERPLRSEGKSTRHNLTHNTSSKKPQSYTHTHHQTKLILSKANERYPSYTALYILLLNFYIYMGKHNKAKHLLKTKHERVD